MADFHQHGPVTTLHRLSDRSVESLEAELLEWSDRTPMALVIPCLASEMDRPALAHIVEEIAKAPYITEVIIGLDRADEAEFGRAREYFSALPQRTRILWNDGPRLAEVDDELDGHAISPKQMGKGRNVWFCLGYYLASGRCEAVAIHDADIITYDREMLARLFYPVVHPTFNYAFCKGYYYRSDGTRLNGRVSRLLVAPLLRALRQVVNPVDHGAYLDYLESFRYPLAGEMSMRQDVVRSLRIPSDWGLEVGILSEVYRRYTPRRICQVELADAYDHKHQDLSADDATGGLHKMTIDIAKATYRKLAIEGAILSPELFRSLKASYYRRALDLVDQYHNDAALNGFTFDRHAEEAIVELFAQAIMDAGDKFLTNPMETPFIASWARVQSAIPDAFEKLVAAVEADNS